MCAPVYLWLCGNRFAGPRISGRATSYSATDTIRIRWRMKMISALPNWVSAFSAHAALAQFFIHSVWGFFSPCLVCVGVLCGWLKSPLRLLLCRAACMEAPRCSLEPIPPCDPLHLHPASSPCRNVLQVGTRRGLHQPEGSHDSL